MISKILVGLDGSKGSFKALEEAIALAKLYNVQLHSISVERIPDFSEVAGEAEGEKDMANGVFKKVVERAKEQALKKGVVLHTYITTGHEAKTINEYIKDNEFDLLVIGFMGHSAVYDRIMGSVCQSLVRLVPCSVMVIK
jgi:nucleotide-binding universal stress UspA family protein